MLADAAINREQDLQEYSGAQILSDSDEENDSDSPIIDGFYSNGGSSTIMKMTNFDMSEFSSICNTFSEYIRENWNVGRGNKSTFKAKDVFFKHFPFSRYATVVTFQEYNRPNGNLQEVKKYFSGKHKLYGYKLEVFVLPNGLAIGCSTHYPGSVAEVDSFY